MKGNRLRRFAQVAIMACGLWVIVAAFVVPHRSLLDDPLILADAPFPLSVNASFAGNVSIRTSRDSFLYADLQSEPAPEPPKATAQPATNAAAPVYTPRNESSPAALHAAISLPNQMEETAEEAEEAPYVYGADAKTGQWFYQDDQMEVFIKRISGTADWGVFTAYVADVRLSDMGAMRALLANASGGSAEQRVETMSVQANAVLAVNGDFYNFRSDGIIVRNGEILRDKPAREMLAIYADGNASVGKESGFDLQNALDEGLLHTYSFGPALVSEGEMPAKYVSAVAKSNPRTAIGMVEPGRFMFVVVDGRQEGHSNGMSMRELGTFMFNLGCVEAYNLDGGASSEMCFMGETINRPSNGGRETSDILCVTSAHDLGFGGFQ